MDRLKVMELIEEEKRKMGKFWILDEAWRTNKFWLVSYPRSGNTWMRFLISNILYPEKDVDYISIGRLVPDIHQRHTWEKVGVENPLVLKSHLIWRTGFSRMIYLYRDPRDVAISCYHADNIWVEKGAKGLTFDEYLKGIFLRGKRSFGFWDAHIKEFLLLSKKPEVHVVPIKYEELWQYPYEEMKKVVEFLKVKVKHTADIQIAINKSSFEELGKFRARDGVHPKMMGLRGKPGGWRKVLTKKQQDLIWQNYGETMERLGYKK